MAGGLHAHPLDVPAWCLAHLVDEHTTEVAQAHRGGCGEHGQSMVAIRGGFHQRLHGAHSRSLGSWSPHRCGELCLPAGPSQEHHQPARHRLGHVHSMIVLHQCEGEVDAGGHASAGPHVTVAHVDRVGVDRHGGELLLQPICSGPVRGHPPPVEQARLRCQECTRAHRRQSPATRRCRGDPLDERAILAGFEDAPSAGQQQRVDLLVGSRQQVGRQPEPRVAAHQAAAGGHQRRGVAATASDAGYRLIGAAEHIERPDCIERLHASKADDDDAARGAPRHDLSMNRHPHGVNDKFPTISAIMSDRLPTGTVRRSALSVWTARTTLTADGSGCAGVKRAPKTCVSCGRTMEWRASWAANWDEVRYCSGRCRNRKVRPVDVALEASILSLLDAGARSATICPSEAARSVDPEGWRDLMEPARGAARRLVASGEVEIIQGGRVVDPSSCKGPFRVRRSRVAHGA